MRFFSGSFKSCNKRDNIKYYICAPDTKPRGIVQIMHGMCESVRFYTDFMRFLAENGFAACAHDASGHGRSVSDGGSLGDIAEHDGARCLVKDMKRMTDIARQRFQGLPVILIGHSMGSFILREYLSWYYYGISGAAFLGTSEGFFFSEGLRVMSDLICRGCGADRHSYLMLKMGCFDFNARMGVLSCGWDWLSRSKRTRVIMDKNSFGYTTAGYRDILRLVSDISTGRWAYSFDRDIPVLIMSGLCDPVGRCGKDAAKLYRRMKAAGCRRLKVRLYKGARHMLLHETNKKQVYLDILKWIGDVLE